MTAPPEVLYFPVRHHSPACARHLEQAIRDRRPDAILVEGPAPFTALIPLILHPDTRAPFAVYCSAASGARDGAPAVRHAAYFPFCDYSPELVALRRGTEIGATLRFIDLPWAEQAAHGRESARHDTADAPRTGSLQEERYFARSRYLAELARRTGSRDHNDLWDHLFETRLVDSTDPSGSVDRFIRDVHAWCRLARDESSLDDQKADGTLAREAAMAAAIRGQIASGSRRVIVVTGGFHSVALPALVSAGGDEAPAPRATAVTEAVDCLVRYGFEQLDALNGYAAGMPSPAYYDRLWHALAADGTAAAFTTVAAEALVDLGRLTRRRRLTIALSTADEIAALEQATRLAALRGHPGPIREDLLDGVRSCFVKGAMDAEGAVIMTLALHSLVGTAVGEVPAAAGVPPLVADFRRTAAELRLDVDSTARRRISLDLYRRQRDRRTSRFLHSVAFLGVPFATPDGGPDFVAGSNLDLLVEHWRHRWTPETESALIEAGVYGATVEEAAAGRLAQAVRELDERGRGRDAVEGVRLLVAACRMGLHAHTAPLLSRVATQVSEDPSLSSIASALAELVLLWESREPLEAHALVAIPAVIAEAYGRASFLMLSLDATPPAAAQTTLDALLVIHELLRAGTAGVALDAAPFHAALIDLVGRAAAPPLLVGGAMGLLYADDRLARDELLSRLSGALDAATSRTGTQADFLVGLLCSCRELAWREPALVAAVDTLLATWSEEEFVARLPQLRMAFSELTPRETDQVGGIVSAVHGSALGPLHRSDVGSDDLLAMRRLDLLVHEALDADGLGALARAVVGGP